MRKGQNDSGLGDGSMEARGVEEQHREKELRTEELYRGKHYDAVKD